jgi:hypothetical protein
MDNIPNRSEGESGRPLCPGVLNRAVGAAESISALAEQARRIAPLLPAPIGLFENLLRAAARGERDLTQVESAKAATSALVDNLRSLAGLYEEVSRRCESLLDANAKQQANTQADAP